MSKDEGFIDTTLVQLVIAHGYEEVTRRILSRLDHEDVELLLEKIALDNKMTVSDDINSSEEYIERIGEFLYYIGEAEVYRGVVNSLSDEELEPILQNII